jgi:uncharacterized phiE125 gp8 family phage protein
VKSITIDIDEPASLPIDLELLKSDLRISSDSLDDVLMEQYIPDAVSWAEGVMHRAIIAREHRWILSDFPRGTDQTIILPRGKVQSVASIAYSSGGSVTTLTGPSSGTSPVGSDYQEDLRGHAGRLMPNRGSSWPSVDADVIAPVVITFTAGWTNHTTVPADIRRAITASVFEAMELNGLLVTKTGFDVDFRDKLISAWRCF